MAFYQSHLIADSHRILGIIGNLLIVVMSLYFRSAIRYDGAFVTQIPHEHGCDLFPRHKGFRRKFGFAYSLYNAVFRSPCDIGRIIRIDGGNVTVVYDDGGKPVFTSFEDEYAYAGISGNKIVYTSAEVDELQLAYAMSVHKSQGSEYPVVILLMVPGHYIMLQRNLFYTAVTRARQKVVIVGSKKAVQAAVLNDKTRKRYSLLAERLQEQADVF